MHGNMHVNILQPNPVKHTQTHTKNHLDCMTAVVMQNYATQISLSSIAEMTT